ncbi:unnamed protein product [Ambrosiozyma monospora]|uniref:Unnamed protein product n=1 Tax=Ambrosiozyma monospora TaxID=43982 RepID=A0ACB5TWG2_AMBMO|nr:unnamed protein product [Ambrosiozyma monospora]
MIPSKMDANKLILVFLTSLLQLLHKVQCSYTREELILQQLNLPPPSTPIIELTSRSQLSDYFAGQDRDYYIVIQLHSPETFTQPVFSSITKAYHIVSDNIVSSFYSDPDKRKRFLQQHDFDTNQNVFFLSYVDYDDFLTSISGVLPQFWIYPPTDSIYLPYGETTLTKSHPNDTRLNRPNELGFHNEHYQYIPNPYESPKVILRQLAFFVGNTCESDLDVSRISGVKDYQLGRFIMSFIFCCMIFHVLRKHGYKRTLLHYHQVDN